jgi:hypothetical protein
MATVWHGMTIGSDASRCIGHPRLLPVLHDTSLGACKSSSPGYLHIYASAMWDRLTSGAREWSVISLSWHAVAAMSISAESTSTLHCWPPLAVQLVAVPPSVTVIIPLMLVPSFSDR